MLALTACKQDSGDSFVVSSPGQHIVAKKSQDIALNCDVKGKDFNILYNPIVWYKLLPDGDQVQINNNLRVVRPFKDTDRYDLTMDDETENTFSLTLHIANITDADNGDYKCEVQFGDSRSDVLHSIEVPAPIQSLTLLTNHSRIEQEGNETKEYFIFDELQPAYVACISKGGYPMPQVKVYRGRTDVTSEFQQTVEKNKRGVKGMETVDYEIALTRYDFMADVDYSGHHLKCVSKVPKRPGQKVKHISHNMKRVATMDVRYAPVFDCDREFSAFPNEQAIMECTIRANPPVEMDQIYWLVGDSDATNTTMINVGETVDGVSANYSVDRMTDHVRASLTIDMVNTTHFKQYTLSVKNPIGESRMHAHLRLATTTMSTSTTEAPKVVNPNEDSKDNPPYVQDPGKSTTDSGVKFVASVLSVLAMLCLQAAIH